ncbi:MAG: restriction endonuclease subunit S [Paracoccaceae bacterium]|nr:restriction endonuclease subunit S [Paracoccaceae bacterium]
MLEGWRHATVEEICQRVSVGIVIKPSQYYVENGEGIRAFRSANIGENKVFDRDWVYLSKAGHEANKKSALREGDVLVVRSGAPGTACVVPKEFAGSNCIDVVFARPDSSQVLPEYLASYTNSEVGKQHVLGNKGGLALQHFNVGAYKEMVVLLPPLPEQRKIAEILRTWDEALEKLTALRQLNIRRRVWFRTHLFTGKVRLPGFTGEWRVVPLSEVLHEHGSKSTGAEEVYSVSVHKGLVNQVEHLGRSFSAANTDHYNRVLPGDIVYTKSPTGDFPLGIIKQSKIDREVIVSPLYGVFTPQTYALGVILDALFESPLAARNYLHPLVQKGAKNTIAVTNSQFLEGKLRLPMDPAEQAAVADIVTASHAECAGIDAEIEALTRQKRGLMQKLLTGEWRVSP